MKPEIARNSNTAMYIRQTSSWLEEVLNDLDNLYKQPMQGDGHKILTKAMMDARNAQSWLDKTEIPERQLPLIDNVKFRTNQ